MPRFACFLVATLGAASAMPNSKPAHEVRKVVQIVPKTTAELETLNVHFGFDNVDVDWWRPPSTIGAPASLLVKPGSATEASLSQFVDISVQVENVDASIAQEAARQETARQKVSAVCRKLVRPLT
eukprot:SAG11_NODE_14015_length_628_cov_2.236295_1_plen_126_part_00